MLSSILILLHMLQAIAVASCVQESWPVLILSPSSLRLHWASVSRFINFIHQLIWMPDISKLHIMICFFCADDSTVAECCTIRYTGMLMLPTVPLLDLSVTSCLELVLNMSLLVLFLIILLKPQ